MGFTAREEPCFWLIAADAASADTRKTATGIPIADRMSLESYRRVVVCNLMPNRRLVDLTLWITQRWAKSTHRRVFGRFERLMDWPVQPRNGRR
jgi:hypothetical protein